jgi:Kef-type K+ transport system membrane component KefB
LVGALVLGIWLVPRIFRHAARAGGRAVVLFSLSLTLCFLLSYLSTLIGLAPIVGAFAAGLILERVPFLGALERNLSRVAIGIGMIPRGEVGLIFAGIGLTLMVDGRRVVDEAAFSAILVMVMVTTLVTPPLLQWSFSRVTEKR